MTYVPYAYLQGIIRSIDDNLYVDFDAAYDIANAIVAAINIAVDNGVTEAKATISAVEQDIRNDMDNSLNLISDWVRSELDHVIDTFGPALTTALTLLSDAQLMGQQSTVDFLDQSYEGIAESHQMVGNYVDTSVAFSEQAVMASHELAVEAITQSNSGALDRIAGIFEFITEIPSKLIDLAISNLAPVLKLMNLDNALQILLSEPMAALIRYLSDKIGEMLTNLIDFDENEVVAFVTKFQQLFNEHLVNMVQTEG